jgi:hypothetical protein
MTQVDDYEAVALDGLRRAVAEALERKRLLGQYAVVWRDGRAVCVGPDAPVVRVAYDIDGWLGHAQLRGEAEDSWT